MIEVTEYIDTDQGEYPIAAEVEIPMANARYHMRMIAPYALGHEPCAHVKCIEQLWMRFEMSFN